jgi:type IV pilus assembly protein PilZ
MAQTDHKPRAPRLHHEIPVAYRTVGSFLSDWATNISRGGLFINTRSPLPVGTAVTILVQLPGASFPCRLEGRVARVTPLDDHASEVPGMGIEFTGLDESQQRELDQFVERLRSELDEA